MFIFYFFILQQRNLVQHLSFCRPFQDVHVGIRVLQALYEQITHIRCVTDPLAHADAERVVFDQRVCLPIYEPFRVLQTINAQWERLSTNTNM